MSKFFLSIVLLLVNAMLFLKPSKTMLFPYVPPLTHTPGMGISLLGEPQPPPFLFLFQLEHLTQSRCTKCPMLEEQHEQNLARGKELRLRMQKETTTLLSLLPQQTLQRALLSRDDNEHRIGEVRVWERLN